MSPSRTSTTSRLTVAGILAAVGVLVVVIGIALGAGDDAPTTAAPTGTPSPSATTPSPSPSSVSPSPTATPTATPTPTPTREVEVPAPEPSPELTGETYPSGQTRLVQVQELTGEGQMSPKSVVANDSGTLFAQNMMYRHTISVFNAAGALVETIPDSVVLSDFGISGHPGTSRGAPVEMAFSPDGQTAWVSNYSMYGEGFGPEGSDSCSPSDGYGNSFLYRIDVQTLEIVDVVEVGAVPKYVAVTPDGSKILVTNWCSWDLSVVDTQTNEEIARVPLDGAYPRGIEVSPDSRTAYVAMMGSDRIVTVDLQSMQMSDPAWSRPGDSPRHLVLSPDGDHLYVANNRSGDVAKVDRATGEVLASVATGQLARSMTIAPDGQALYVVNYGSGTMSKIRASDMTVIQEVETEPKPIGITYEPTLRRVWVASYGGTIQVYDDAHRQID